MILELQNDGTPVFRAYWGSKVMELLVLELQNYETHVFFRAYWVQRSREPLVFNIDCMLAERSTSTCEMRAANLS